jgi:small multidrug resistance family-3 protein
LDKKKETVFLGLVGGVILFIYGILPTLQPSNFGRVYAAYGGIFVVFSVVWGVLIDKKKPGRFEVIGSLVVLSGAAIIFYGPR